MSDGIIVGLRGNRIVAYALSDMHASLEIAEMNEIHIVKEFITVETAISLVREVMKLAREYSKHFLCFRMDTDFIPELRMVFSYLPGGCTLTGGALIMVRDLKEPIPDYKPASRHSHQRIPFWRRGKDRRSGESWASKVRHDCRRGLGKG